MKLMAKQRLLAAEIPQQETPMLQGQEQSEPEAPAVPPSPQPAQTEQPVGAPQDTPAPQAQGPATFLPQRLVMVDCEMTGLNMAKDDIIQLAALKLMLKNGQYVQVGQEFNQFVHTDKEPESQFARQYMVEIYRKAQQSKLNYQDLGSLFKVWLGDWLGKVSPAGDCVPTDIMFLVNKGVITTSYYEGDEPVEGTFFYEFFDMNALKAAARTKVGSKFDKQLKRLPGDHDALIDCKNQTMELNAFLKVLIGGAKPKAQAPKQQQPAPQPQVKAPPKPAGDPRQPQKQEPNGQPARPDPEAQGQPEQAPPKKPVPKEKQE
jgi:oligoribonuclease (3'-5' exoribonuclease)